VRADAGLRLIVFRALVLGRPTSADEIVPPMLAGA
jgi:hypothetical protein